MVSGSLTVDDIKISTGDGLAIEDVYKIILKSPSKGELLLFDLH